MKKILFFILIYCSLECLGQSDWQNIIVEPIDETVKFESSLWKLTRYHDNYPEKTNTILEPLGFVTNKESEIYIEVFSHIKDFEVSLDALNRLPLRIQNHYRGRYSCWVHLKDLHELHDKLPLNYFVEGVQEPQYDNEGPARINSSTYNSNDNGGFGLKIAIIDGDFNGLSAAQSVNAAPTVISYDWPGDGIEDESNHGSRCLETVFDHAPAATYYIHKVKSVVDFGNAIDQIIEDEIDVVSHSMSWYNTGWNDNTGDICTAVNSLITHDILFFSSAGNRQGQHWQGSFAGNDSQHDWFGGDETNRFFAWNNSPINLWLQWEGTPNSNNNLDLVLRDFTTNNILGISNNINGFETISYTNTGTSPQDVFVQVIDNDGTIGTTEFEIILTNLTGLNFQYFSTQGSTVSPSNCTNPYMFVVGAVPEDVYDNPSSTVGQIASYSSRGPSNGGVQNLDMCGPTNTTTFLTGQNGSSSFGGTSCATPNAAGAAAAFWSRHNTLSINNMRILMQVMPALYKDWGIPGYDNVYGYGGLYWYPYDSKNIFLDNFYGTNYETPSSLIFPWDNLRDINSNLILADDRNVIMLTDDPVSAPELITKPMIIKSAVENRKVY